MERRCDRSRPVPESAVNANIYVIIKCNLALVRPAPRRTCFIYSQRGELDNELATSRVLLFRRPVSGQCRAAFCQRHYGKTLSDTVRKTSRKGSLVLDGECPLGLREFCLRLSACAASRTLRSAIHRLHRAVRS